MKRAVLVVVLMAGVLAAATYPMLLKYPRYVQGEYSTGTPGNGVPFAVLIGVRDDVTPGTFHYKPRLLQLVTATARYNFWVDSTATAGTPNTWNVESYAWVNCPQVTVTNTTDTARVWTAMKCIAPTSAMPEQEEIRLTMRRVGSTTNINQVRVDTVQAMDMTASGTGGWLSGHIYGSSGGPLLANYAVLAYRNDTIVGSCISEDNRIIEGYPADPGYFLMAVRAGTIDSISVYGRTSYITPSPHYTQVGAPWTVVAGDTTFVDSAVGTAGPTISTPNRTPAWPLSFETVGVSARIFETGVAVDSARLLYAAGDTAAWTVAAEDSVRASDSTYLFHIAPQDTGATVYWHIRAWSTTGMSRTATAAYAIPLDHSIQQIQFTDTAVSNRTPDSGRYVHTLGIVTGIVRQDRFYIGDVAGGPWNGMFVFRTGTITDTVRVGDLLSVAGVISEYHGLTQFDNPYRITRYTTGVPFETTTVTIAQARQEAFEGVLVRLDTIDVLDSTGTFNAGRTYRVTNYGGTDTINLYVLANSGFAGTAIPSDWATLVCNVSDFDGRQLQPRVPGDIFLFVPDVAVTALVSPDTVTPGADYTPVVEVRNLSSVGTAQNFTVGFRIGSSYHIQQQVGALAPGEVDTLSFESWTATPGAFAVRAYTALARDPVPQNDTLRATLRVAGGTAGAWTPVGLMPLTPSGRQSKDGAWMVEVNDQFYVAKGTKTEDFYRYNPAVDSWYTLTGMPRGVENKPASKGACAAVGDYGIIYAIKGNNTSAFYSYEPATDQWTKLADVPPGPGNKRVKGGSDLLYYRPQGQPESTYLYLLKGVGTEFYRYSIQSGAWEPMADAPAGAKPKWDRGSWLALERNPGHDRYKIYAHKAKYHEHYRYDIPTNTWEAAPLKPMPLASRLTAKSRKTKEGCAVMADDAIFAFKAANTQEFWKYDIAGDSWTELDTIPAVGPSGRKKRVKAGSDLLAYNGLIYALKGNKSNELWYFNPGAVKEAVAGRPSRDGVAARPVAQAAGASLVAPRVVNGAALAVRYTLPASGPAQVRLVGADGRVVLAHSLHAGRSGAFDLAMGELPSGVYLLTLNSGSVSLSRQLAVLK